MGQIDLFGNEVQEIEKPKHSGRRYKTMIEIHGVLLGKTCKTCKHCIAYHYNRKTYYKCELWILSNSSATDIRLKNTACKKYEEEQ